ncbi:MAG: ABC transporter ATP-binding protein [Desulfurococcales archaeon]
MEMIATLKDVTYTYPDGTRALNGVSLGLKKESVICLMGPNGSGKSTLLMVLDALIFPQSGEVELFGRRVEKNNAPQLRKKIGLLFQNPDDMLFNPNVLEEVAFGLIVRGIPREKSSEKAEEELKKLGLEQLKDRIPHRLSFGQRRLVSLASVLVTEPELLLLDEPTSNLDEENKEKMMKRLHEFISSKNSEEWAVVIATQDKEIEVLCNETYYMKDGKIVI